MDSDLVHRSSGGGFVYLGFVVALCSTSDYFSRHPFLIIAVSIISALCAAARWLLGYRFKTMYAGNPRIWRMAYYLSVTLISLVWGTFLAATFLLFGFGDWKTLLLLICLAGTAPIALASLSPDLLLLRWYLFALSLPMICANVYAGGSRDYVMAFIFLWYLLFALFYAQTIHRQYTQYTEEKFALAAAKTSAENANKAKATFLAHMSHELRTPMNAILGMTHLALNSPLNAGQRQYLEGVKSSSQTLLRMLNGLLDLSKIGAGKMELENTEFSISDLVDQSVQSFTEEVQRQGLRLESRLDDDVPAKLRGDPLRLGQVLLNVVGNAVKFTTQGVIKVRISRVNEIDRRVTLQFEVRDSGIGIAPEKHQSIFEPFEQADSSTTRKYGGSGLGLAISSQIVELMGGKMWLESELGRGSVFYWTASFARLATDDSALSPVALEKTEETHAKIRVLIAEDHDISREFLKELIEQRGPQVTAVSDGRQVLDEMARQSFDLILMDIHMPQMDGVAATIEIRRREGDGPHIPIVAVTADAAASFERHYLVAGFTGHISKPIDPETLFATIERLGRLAAGSSEV